MTEAPSSLPDKQAAVVVEQLTLDEKIQLVTGFPGVRFDEDGKPIRVEGMAERQIPPPGAIGSDGFVPGVNRLGIPDLQLVGSGAGLTDMSSRPGGSSTAYPSPLAQTATWDPRFTEDFGSAFARTARAAGFNVLLAGAINLAVDPRCGRLFEYHGEDPILAGEMTAGEIRGAQREGIVASIKHFAANFQERGRFFVSSVIDERPLRQGELLAFEVAIANSNPGAVMTAYNRLNGAYCTENPYLLHDVLKGEWAFPGWVMSDWGATHSTVPAALAGLDQEFCSNLYFGEALRQAIEAGSVPLTRLDDMVQRILRGLFAVGVMPIDTPSSGEHPLDVAETMAVAQRISERSIVLLTNDGLLPLDPATVGSVLVVGGHADIAVPSGGGSAVVNPIGNDPVSPIAPDEPLFWRQIWIPSSPVEAIRSRVGDASIAFLSGEDVPAASAAAQHADVTIVFATQWATERVDVPDLRLPDGQDDLINALSGACSKTIVVLETGAAVLTPWADDVSAVLEAWYPGHRGGEAIARVLFGEVAPAGKLPVTFPASEGDLARRVIPPIPVRAGYEAMDDSRQDPDDRYDWVDDPYEVAYDEGLAIGYKWFDQRNIEPAFCFGHGLSYTTFGYGDLEVSAEHHLQVRFTLTNTGERAGIEVAQVYAALPAGSGEPPRRLVGWSAVELQPGESRRIELAVTPKYLSIWDVESAGWRRLEGTYEVFVGTSSRDLALGDSVEVPELIVGTGLG